MRIPFTFEGETYDVGDVDHLRHYPYETEFGRLIRSTTLRKLPKDLYVSVGLVLTWNGYSMRHLYVSDPMPEDIRTRYEAMKAAARWWWPRRWKDQLLADIRAMMTESLRPYHEDMRRRLDIRIKSFRDAADATAPPLVEAEALAL